MGRGRRFLDTQYGIRKDGEQLMIGDYPGFIDTDDNFTIKGTAFRGTEGLWDVDVIRAWLERQDSYTLLRPVMKRFASNPYAVTNVMDVWERDLLDVQAYAKYNDNHRYILSVIVVFSKFVHIIPVKTKSGPTVTSHFGPYSMTLNIRLGVNNIFRTCYGTRVAFSFRCVETPI